MSASASSSLLDAPWLPQYERLAIHFSSCPTCTAVDKDGVNLGLACAEGERVSHEYRQACRGA